MCVHHSRMLALERVLVSISYAPGETGMVREAPWNPARPLPPLLSSLVLLGQTSLQPFCLETLRQEVLCPGLWLILRIWGQKMRRDGDLSMCSSNKSTVITAITGRCMSCWCWLPWWRGRGVVTRLPTQPSPAWLTGCYLVGDAEVKQGQERGCYEAGRSCAAPRVFTFARDVSESRTTFSIQSPDYAGERHAVKQEEGSGARCPDFRSRLCFLLVTSADTIIALYLTFHISKMGI